MISRPHGLQILQIGSIFIPPLPTDCNEVIEGVALTQAIWQENKKKTHTHTQQQQQHVFPPYHKSFKNDL